jgi:lipopolysaccharide transport system ATP-binding protein
MTDRSIKVENLSKKYIIGKHTQKGDGLRHIVQNALGSPFRWASNGFRRDPRTYEEFWALDDINFEVGVGEVVGIIGRNGAGKSTLLKVLSRITEQTTGRITLRGRMASLLEVGTGFHPELTGRENIYLNGAILGMTRLEIKRKFDEIVDFAEVEQFLDTPVKRYSSGMYVRLAFAVAAHLEPEILVVDEVLAVGDIEFQKKCLGKMSDVADGGRTVLFVSHNMAAVQRLCDRSIVLSKGKKIFDGGTNKAIDQYLADTRQTFAKPLPERTDRAGTGDCIATSLTFLDQHGHEITEIASGTPTTVRVGYKCREGKTINNASVNVSILREDRVCSVLSSVAVRDKPMVFSGEGFVDLIVESWPFTEGLYQVDIYLESEVCHDAINAAEVHVVDGDFFGTGRIRPNHHWKDVGVLVNHRCEPVIPTQAILRTGS